MIILARGTFAVRDPLGQPNREILPYGIRFGSRLCYFFIYFLTRKPSRMSLKIRLLLYGNS